MMVRLMVDMSPEHQDSGLINRQVVTMANTRRAYKIADKIRTTIAMELQRLADPRLYLVTITAAVISPDLRQAKVYWVATGGKERVEEITQAFKSAEGFFKRILAKELGVRFVPDIHFHYDDTLDTVEEVERLMARVRKTSGE